MVACQHHRGPDAQGVWVGDGARVGLGHNRLSIIDLSDSGEQPMASPDGRRRLLFNGEIYNYRELRDELDDYPYRSRTDTEVILAAWDRWGEGCLDRFVGMFSFLIWDDDRQTLFGARDRFGKKPLYYHHRPDGGLVVASEIAALHAAGVPAEPDPVAWSTYLTHGLLEHSERTFWKGISSLEPGRRLRWDAGQLEIRRWYDLAAHIGPWDDRPLGEVEADLLERLVNSVRLRLRADVPVGINLSGGLDSSILLGLVDRVQGSASDVRAFTFATGDERYDELPWAEQMLEKTSHPWTVCRLSPAEVPELARSVQAHQSEPVGGLPTIAYAKLFAEARRAGVKVLLDGQGMDEQWAGYDYYRRAAEPGSAALIQGTSTPPVRPQCLTREFRDQAEAFVPPRPFPDALRNLQYRDVAFTKIRRALRFNDRISMQSSTELRSPFLDHRLFELAFRQPAERKIRGEVHKWLPRQLVSELLPAGVAEAPKRPLQTPQREWLRGPLRGWATERIDDALDAYGESWLDPAAVRGAWARYCSGEGDNSFYVWQWISLGLMAQAGGLRESRGVQPPRSATTR